MCIEVRRQFGITLIELIIFIVIVSAGLAGVLTVLNVTTRSSADPMIRKQALAIAEALLEEVMLQPFTWCDPNDVKAADAKEAKESAIGCSAGKVQSFGQPSGQARSPYTFNNVANYCATQVGGTTCPTLNLPSPISNISTGAAPLGYSATIGLTAENLGGITSSAPSANDATTMNVLRITVTVSHTSGESIVLEGYRTRYAPNSLP